jgi:hypothetical protein
MNENTPILYITHDTDGIWQCLNSEVEVKEEDAVVLSLDEVIEIDPTLLEIIHIPMGSKAFRKKVGAEWVVINDD